MALFKADLPDVNVWLALAAPDHVHHDRAVAYWRNESLPAMVFCRTTMLGFVRVSSSPRFMDGQPLTPIAAWNAWQKLCDVPGITLAPEPPGCDGHLAGWVGSSLVSSRLWTDAWLAAFAVAGNYRLVSFHSDFSRFAGLAWKHLVPETD